MGWLLVAAILLLWRQSLRHLLSHVLNIHLEWRPCPCWPKPSMRFGA